MKKKKPTPWHKLKMPKSKPKPIEWWIKMDARVTASGLLIHEL